MPRCSSERRPEDNVSCAFSKSAFQDRRNNICLQVPQNVCWRQFAARSSVSYPGIATLEHNPHCLSFLKRPSIRTRRAHTRSEGSRCSTDMNQPKLVLPKWCLSQRLLSSTHRGGGHK